MARQLQKKFIGNDQVDGSKILLEQGQSVRAKDSNGVEQDLVKFGASDEILVNGSEVAYKANLDQEIADRQSGDASTLSSANTYTDGEISTVNSSIAQEISDRESAFQSLDTYISSVEDSLAQEVSDRQAADANLQSQINNIGSGGSSTQSELDVTQVGAGLNSDGSYSPPGAAGYLATATSLSDADLKLDLQIQVVSNGLAQEISDRADADIQAVSDANAYTDAEIATLESTVQSEVGNLQSQIDNVLSNVDPGALDSLTEIVTAFQAADANLNGAITALSTGLSADIDAEEAARIAADSALQGEIDAEEVARAAADVTLQNNINAEASARQSADNALDARVDVLESVVWFKEKFSISNGQTSVTLSHVPENKSISAFVDRLAIHEGASEDFTVIGTSMTFLNDLVSPGQSQIGNGDTIYVKYQYKV